ncbi:uncharacterized protein GO595_000768 [Histomonas meleagridis]|uniref:uncharacterized protein n=1 Tax=Histomonas meleagridis TaxID=135588 RepID=UPI00355A5E1B|nr:hypothetical protein GO595_000768 [Histomonas meleagridis]
MDVSFAGEWEEEKSNVDFISRGRRTEAYVQRPVAIDSDGMENITDFWNAAGKDEEISQVPTPLFKSNQKSTISLSHSIQDPPSEIPVSPEISENENIEPEIPSESISFQTPKPPNPKPNKTRPNRLPRYVDTNSPSDGMTPAIKAAHSIRNVRATPPPTPSTPQITPPSAKTESPHQKNNTPKAPQLSVGVQPTPVQKYEPPPQRDSVFSRLKNYKFDEPQNKHEENNERIRIPPDNKRRISRLDSETTEQEIPSIIPQRTEEETTKRKFDDFKRPNFEVWKGNINNFEEMAIRQRNNDFNELLEDTYNVKRIPTLPNRISRIEDNSMRIDDLIQPIEVEVKQQIPKRFNNEQRKDKTVTIGDAYSVNIPKRSKAEENMKRVQFNENETFFGNRTQNERNDNEEREQFNESRTFFRKRANKERNDNEERDQFNESRTFFRNRANKERNDNEEREQFDENRTFFGNRANKERNDNEEREQFDESRTFFGNREQNIKRVHFDNSQNETTKLQSNLYVNETEQNIKRVHFDNAQNETTKVQSNLYVNETEQNIKRVHFDDAQNEIETPRIERAEPAIFKSEPQPTNGISRLTRIVDTSAVSSMITTPMNEMQMLSEEINNIKTNGTNNSFRNNVTKFEFNPSTTNIRNSPSPSDNETSIIAEASDIESPIPLDISDDDVQITEGINEEREQLLTSPPPSNITNVSDSESSELNLSDVPFSAINSPPSKSDNVPLSVPLWDESDNDQPKDDENLQQQHQKNDKNVKQRNSRRKRILDGISVTLTEDDNLPIALRKKRRPKTKPLRFWMGEKIIYHPDENGCLTKSGVIEINEKSPDESTLVHHKSTKNTRKEALSAFEVIPKRIEPAAEKTEFIDRFQGIENSIVVSSEVMVHPNQIFKIVATKERIVIHIASGKAELVSRGKRWKVSSGGTVFISKGDECTFKNNDDKVPLRLFRVNVE